jgi:hypothetical protein
MSDTHDRTPVSPVYPPLDKGVNPPPAGAGRRRAWVARYAWAALSAAVGGCTLAPPRPTVAPPQLACPLGIGYSVESVRAGDRDLARRVDTDLATIRRMGLNIVFFRHVDPDRYGALAAAAHRHQLCVVFPDRAAQEYVLTGAPALDAVRADGPAAFSARDLRSVLWAVDLGRAVDPESATRLEQVATVYRADPALPPTFAQTAGAPPASLAWSAGAPVTEAPTAGSPGKVAAPRATRSGVLPEPPPEPHPLMTVSCDLRADETSADAVRRWWWQFHAALARGYTGGLLVDRYYRIPGRGSALADPNGDVSIERINAVKRLAGRMQRWSPLLNRLSLKPLAPPSDASPTLSLSLFARDRRRLLLVFNRSTAEYLRTTLTLGDTLDGVGAERLVEVPGDTDATLGAVIEARRGVLTVTLDLAPGDARLYEVF